MFIPLFTFLLNLKLPETQLSSVNEKLNEGSYEVEWNGSNYSSGVYFYKLEAEGTEKFIETKRMILIK